MASPAKVCVRWQRCGVVPEGAVDGRVCVCMRAIVAIKRMRQGECSQRAVSDGRDLLPEEGADADGGMHALSLAPMACPWAAPIAMAGSLFARS